MSENGFIKLYRKIQKSSMYRSLNSKQRDVMIQCLLLANHAGKEWEWGGEIYQCAPGQFITSLESLRNACAKDVKIQSIRTALLKLEKWHFLTNKSTKRGSLITIVNWASYQSITNQPTKKSTDNQQRANKELTTNKNVENVENEKNNKTFPQKNNFAEESEEEYYLTRKKRKLKGKRLESFNRFWEAFGYKKDKAGAADAWLDIPALTDKMVDTICAAAKKEARLRPETIAKGRVPIYAQGWITGRRWEDEDFEEEESLEEYAKRRGLE